MADDQTKLDGLKEVWKLCKARDDEKKTLIEVWLLHRAVASFLLTCVQGLFRHIDDLSGQLSIAESELRDKRDVIKVIRDNVEKADMRIMALEREKARSNPNLLVKSNV